MVDPSSERPGRVAGTAGSESWEFVAELAEPAALLLVRLTWSPGTGTASYCAALSRPGSWVVVLDDELSLGSLNRSLEVRHEGIWASHHCERELERWTVGLEAFGVEVEDLGEVVERGWGTRTGLGLDMEWEATGPPVEVGPCRYEVPAGVHGEVLVAHDEHPAASGSGCWRRWWDGAGSDRRAWRLETVRAAVAVSTESRTQPTTRPAE